MGKVRKKKRISKEEVKGLARKKERDKQGRRKGISKEEGKG